MRPHKRSDAEPEASHAGSEVQREPDHSEGSLRSRCRFAALNPFMLRCYRLIADVECTGVLKLVFHYSLFTIHCSLRSRCRFYCRFARPHRLCQTIREDNRSTAETLRNPHYVRVRGDDLKARKMLDLSEVRVRPHKRSAANLKRLASVGNVNANPSAVRVQPNSLSGNSLPKSFHIFP